VRRHGGWTQAVVASLLLGAASAGHAENDGFRWHQALMYNGVPVPLIDTPGYTTPKCFLPYPVCKVQWALLGTVAAVEKLIVGGDVRGARDSVVSGFTGDWVVMPRHVGGDPVWSLPFPVTFGVALLTGRGNGGPVSIDPYRVEAREPVTEGTTEGDVLPP
jgi:hypothetical protein